MFRDLLVHIDGTEAGRERLHIAIHLAKSFEASLSGLHVTPPVELAPMWKPSLVPVIVAEVGARLAEDAIAAAAIFREGVQGQALDQSWIEESGDIAQIVCDRARYADLVIVGQYEEQGCPQVHPLPIAHSVVLRCGRPVLVVPAGAGTGAFSQIALAWDGSREAVRAVHDAIPLMRRAGSVTVLIVPRRSADGGSRDLETHLAHHGIHARTQVVETGALAEHEALRAEFTPGKYDLIVLGGYSHAVWREFIFGGATESILLNSATPMFVSH